MDSVEEKTSTTAITPAVVAASASERQREGEERSLLVTSHQSLLYPLPFPMKETRAVTVIVITGKVSEMCAEDVDSGKDGRPYPTGCGHHTAWPVRVCHT